MHNWSSFEHLIWKNLTAFNLHKHENFLLAVSGGIDSMALLHVMLKLRPRANFKLVHYHHGMSDDESVRAFRDQSLAMILKQAADLKSFKLNVFFQMSQDVLRSEEDFRNARWAYIKQIAAPDDVLITAHHLDDRFETLFLKLIRGTSLEGVRTFQMWNSDVFRPFLNSSKSEITQYALNEGLVWIDDPSNAEVDYLRNWVRQKWLPDLEQRAPGATSNFAKSIFKIIDSSTENQDFEIDFNTHFTNLTLSRSWFLLLSKNDQIRSLALFLKAHKIFDFTAGQLEEIRKRLDKNQKDITFEILGRKWVINALQIVLQ